MHIQQEIDALKKLVEMGVSCKRVDTFLSSATQGTSDQLCGADNKQ